MSGLNSYLLLSGSPMREDGTDLRGWSEDKQQQDDKGLLRQLCAPEAVEQLYEDMRRDQGLPDWRPPQAIEQLVRRQRP